MASRETLSRTIELVIIFGLGACLFAPVAAEPASPALRAPTSPFAVNTRLTPIPATFARVEDDAKCRSWCSAFHPGEVVTEISWPEADTADQPDADARLDITAAAAGVAGANFATVRLAAVPMATARAEGGVDLEMVKTRMAPALLQPVENGRIMARPAKVRTLSGVLRRRDMVARRLPNADRTRANAGGEGLGMLQTATAVVQQHRSERGRLVHVLTLEGLEPGLSYEFAVRTKAMAAPALNLCRIPVCPTDMVATPPR
ncbi:hypothetical protein [Sandarakinorhabdus sp.]|uniref:hypothetical protein n=1 Tax=Sandarakinorhabdus sp. TaxID=1916663 RepID=UPI00286DFD93|nr:hypothetical protein [Sandarakinorhabdus sp.]